MGKLLVVEDEDLVRQCVTALLTSFGHEVLEAKDGVEALLTYQVLRAEITLVLMDINMPRMDGIAVARVLKCTDPNLKIILISGHTEQIPSGLGVTAFLPKPFLGSELAAVVQRVLSEAPDPRALAAGPSSS